jgi:hypothetical protein
MYNLEAVHGSDFMYLVTITSSCRCSSTARSAYSLGYLRAPDGDGRVRQGLRARARRRRDERALGGAGCRRSGERFLLRREQVRRRRVPHCSRGRGGLPLPAAPGLNEAAHLAEAQHRSIHARLAALRAGRAARDVACDVASRPRNAAKAGCLKRAVPAELVAAPQACERQRGGTARELGAVRGRQGGAGSGARHVCDDRGGRRPSGCEPTGAPVACMLPLADTSADSAE